MSTPYREVKSAFDARARSYDATRRQLIPCFDDFYGMVGRLMPFSAEVAADVLDLGAGTGLLSSQLQEQFPKARFTLVDISDEMLALARDRFAGQEVRILLADYAHEPIPGRFDAVVSALSIHHLTHEDKQALFGRIFDALNPGGVFANADEVLASTPAVEAFNQAEWEREARSLGAGDEIDAARQRMSHDIVATLDDQLKWLRKAGFTDVDCHYKSLMFAVYAGRKPA